MTTFQALPFRVRVRRWYSDPTQWTFIAGMVLTGAQLALQNIGLLHLSDAQQFEALIGLNLGINALGAWLHYQSTHVIGNSDDVAVAAATPPVAGS